MKIVENITELVGKTPLVKLKKLSGSYAMVLGKLESSNPCFSVKDRIALAMIIAAETAGRIDASTVVVEPTSGNTGIGLAFVCAQRGYRLILTMPDSMTVERRKLLKRLGAELVLTPAAEGMTGAIEKAKAILSDQKGAYMPQQFENPANPEAHYQTTGPEIWNDTGGEIAAFVAGVGTGGTISGSGRYLKEQNPEILVVAVEPAESPVISTGHRGPHKIQGIGAGFIPKNYNSKVVDEVLCVESEDALETSKRLAQEEGILAGISAGANVWAALQVAKRPEMAGKNIVTIICDTGERYLSFWSD